MNDDIPPEVQAEIASRLAAEETLFKQLVSEVGVLKARIISELTTIAWLATFKEIPEETSQTLIRGFCEVAQLDLDKTIDWISKLGRNRLIAKSSALTPNDIN